MTQVRSTLSFARVIRTLRSQLNMRSKDSCLPNKYLPLPLYSYVLIVAKQKKTNSCF